MKKLLSLVLVLVLSLNLAMPALAESEPVEENVAITAEEEAAPTENVAEEPAEEDVDEVTEEDAISIIISDTEEEQIEAPVNEVPAGITPDSLFYFFDRLIEDIRLALARAPEAKAQLLADISRERLAEIEALDPEKLDKYIDTLLEEIASALQKAADAVSVAKENGAEVTALVETLKLVAQNGANIMLPEAVRREETEQIRERVRNAANSIKVVAAVANVPTEVISTLREEGLGYGQIALLHKLALNVTAETDEARLEQVIAVFAENKSIGQTMKAFNLNQGQVKKQAKTQKPAEDEDEDEEEAVVQRVKNKGKDNTPAKGKGK